MFTYPHTNSFCTMAVLYTHTRILKPFEESELMGLDVDIATKTIPLYGNNNQNTSVWKRYPKYLCMEMIPKIPLYRNDTQNTPVQKRYPKYLCMEMIPKIPLYRNDTQNTPVQKYPKYLCMEMIPKIPLYRNHTQNSSVCK